jgi:hypothetical protein
MNAERWIMTGTLMYISWEGLGFCKRWTAFWVCLQTTGVSAPYDEYDLAFMGGLVNT